MKGCTITKTGSHAFEVKMVGMDPLKADDSFNAIMKQVAVQAGLNPIEINRSTAANPDGTVTVTAQVNVVCQRPDTSYADTLMPTFQDRVKVGHGVDAKLKDADKKFSRTQRADIDKLHKEHNDGEAARRQKAPKG